MLPEKWKPTQVSRLPFGPIWIEVGDEAFPRRDWEDFPIVILEWWISSFLLRTQKKGGFTLEFMETSDYVELVQAEHQELQVFFRRDDLSELAESSKRVVSLKKFQTALLVRSQKALRVCEMLGWLDHDWKNLKSAVEILASKRGNLT